MLLDHERVIGLCVGPPDPADAHPAHPRRRRQGRRTARAAPPGRGPAPPGPPPGAAPGGPVRARGAVAAAAPRTLVGVLRHPGHAAALAPPAPGQVLDLPAPARPPTDRPAATRPDPAPGPGEPDLGSPENPG